MNDKQWVDAGYNIMKGIFKWWFWPLLIIVSWGLFQDVDDCDKSRWERCGLEVKTDNKTGKQYLISPYGGIIERK